MKSKTTWMKIAYIFGIVALIAGLIDPLEGSILIVIGSVVLAISTYLRNDPYRKGYIISAALIIIGVGFLLYLSSIGGFGGNSSLSWWWGVLIIPYPLGWILSVVLLIIKAIKRPVQQKNS